MSFTEKEITEEMRELAIESLARKQDEAEKQAVVDAEVERQGWPLVYGSHDARTPTGYVMSSRLDLSSPPVYFFDRKPEFSRPGMETGMRDVDLEIMNKVAEKAKAEMNRELNGI